MIKWLKRVFHFHRYDEVGPYVHFKGINKSMTLVECSVCGKRGIRCSDILFDWCTLKKERTQVEEQCKFHIFHPFSADIVLATLQKWLDHEISMEKLISGIEPYDNAITLIPHKDHECKYNTLKP